MNDWLSEQALSLKPNLETSKNASTPELIQKIVCSVLEFVSLIELERQSVTNNLKLTCEALEDGIMLVDRSAKGVRVPASFSNM